MTNKFEQGLVDLPEAEFRPRRGKRIVSAELDEAMAAAFDAELSRRGFTRNQVVKGWIAAWVAKVSAEAQDRQIAA